MPPNGSGTTPEVPGVTALPSTGEIVSPPLTVTGNPNDANMLQAAADAAKRTSQMSTEVSPRSIDPAQEITIPDFVTPLPSEAATSPSAPEVIIPSTPPMPPNPPAA